MTRRQKLEALLAESPEDTFLQYALAMQVASDGDEPEAARRLEGLLAADPSYVPAYLQLGQLHARLQDPASARSVLTRGIETARRAGDQHAEGEMRGFLDELGPQATA
jgi:predicted Zn-dependent protease